MSEGAVLKVNAITVPVGSLVYLHGIIGSADRDRDGFRYQHHDYPGIAGIFPKGSMMKGNLGQSNVAWYQPFGISDTKMNTVNVASFEASVSRVHELIQKEIQSGVPPKMVFVGGFGQGGSVALHAGLTTKTPIGGIFIVSSWLQSPHVICKRAKLNRTTPIMHCRGFMDKCIEGIQHLNLNVIERQYNTGFVYGIGQVLDDFSNFVADRIADASEGN